MEPHRNGAHTSTKPEDDDLAPTAEELAFYKFCAKTNFHGLDKLRPTQHPCLQLLWTACTVFGVGAFAVVAISLFRQFTQERTGVNQVFLDERAGLGTFQACYSAFLPDQPALYPPPHPDHVAAFLRAPQPLRDIIATASGLWFKSPAKSRARAQAEAGLSPDEERLFFAEEVFRDLRPPNGAFATYREEYDELLRLANATTFPELIAKLIPQARFPLVRLNEADSGSWEESRFLVANKRQFCQIFTPNSTRSPTKIELTVIFPAVHVVSIDYYLGHISVDFVDSNGLLMTRVSRPLSDAGEEIDPESYEYQVAFGKVPESPKDLGHFALPNTKVQLSYRAYHRISRRRFPCLPGLEPSPTRRDRHKAHRPRDFDACTPLDETFLPVLDSRPWASVCDPWELRAAERAALRENSSMELFADWISREETPTGPSQFCQSAVYKELASTTSRSAFYSEDAVIEAAFSDEALREHYAPLLKAKGGGFAEPALYRLTLETRGLPGDGVLVEQFLLMKTDALFAQLGGFIGLFLGGSVVSLVHLLYFVGRWLVPSRLRRKKSIRTVESVPQSLWRECGCSSTKLFLAAILLSLPPFTVFAAWQVGAFEPSPPPPPPPAPPFNEAAFFAFSYDLASLGNSSSTTDEEEDVCGPRLRLLKEGTATLPFASPGHPAAYPNGLDCQWSFVAPGRRLSVAFEDFATERKFDTLTLQGSGNRSAKCSGTVCGGFANDEALTLHFVTDRTEVKRGFSLTVTAESKPSLNEVPEGGACLDADRSCMHKSRDSCYTSRLVIQSLRLGEKRTTWDGTECQSWAAHSPHGHYRHTAQYWDRGLAVEAAGNLCGNADGLGLGPWCYTTNPHVRWDYCYHDCNKMPLSVDESVVSPKTQDEVLGRDPCGPSMRPLDSDGRAELVFPGFPLRYYGALNCTWSFAAEDRRLRLTVHPFPGDATFDRVIVRGHNFAAVQRAAAEYVVESEEGISLTFNVLRNDPWGKGVSATVQALPDSLGRPRCVDVEAKCMRSYSAACKAKAAFYELRQLGWAETETGTPCQAWTEDEPHRSDRKAKQYWDFGVTKEAAGNICVNLDGSKGPWCYTTNPNVRWQYCLPDCPQI